MQWGSKVPSIAKRSSLAGAQVNTHTHNHTCEAMSYPSKVVAWECDTCAYTNEDAMRRICLACQARHPVRYAIVTGAAAAATARTTRADCCNQACVAVLVTSGPPIAGEAATSANAAIARVAPTAAYGPPAVAESAAMHPRNAPKWGAIVQALLLAWSIQWSTL
jgi:hypothetical protein